LPREIEESAGTYINEYPNILSLPREIEESAGTYINEYPNILSLPREIEEKCLLATKHYIYYFQQLQTIFIAWCS